MAQINWDETVPADGELISLGDDRLRSLKTSIRVGMAAEHIWPSAGGDAGIHLLGSARAFYGPQSNVSSSGTDGRLMVSSDHSTLFHVGSGGTMWLGSANGISAVSDPVGGQRYIWAEDFGEANVSNDAAPVTVNFPGGSFNGVPILTTSMFTTNGGVVVVPMITSISASGFVLRAWDTFGNSFVSNVTVLWHSIGTRTL